MPRRQSRQQRKVNVDFLTWRRGLVDESRAFLDTLSTDELQRLTEIDDEAERLRILEEMREAAEQKEQAKADADFTRWYLDISEKDREIVDALSQEEIQNLADLPVDLRNKMLRWFARKQDILRQKERREQRTANLRTERRNRRIRNLLSRVGQKMRSGLSSPVHSEVRQWMREKAVSLRVRNIASIARRDAVRRMMPDYMWALIATLLVVLGAIFVGYSQK